MSCIPGWRMGAWILVMSIKGSRVRYFIISYKHTLLHIPISIYWCLSTAWRLLSHVFSWFWTKVVSVVSVVIITSVFVFIVTRGAASTMCVIAVALTEWLCTYSKSQPLRSSLLSSCPTFSSQMLSEGDRFRFGYWKKLYIPDLALRCRTAKH